MHADLAAIVRDHARTHTFDGTVLVRQRGRKVYHRSFGVADRAFGVPLRNDTRYRIASITKAFTATLVLQLCDQGKFDLDRTVRACLSDYTGEGGGTIRIRHLLNHTSGLPNLDAGLNDYAAACRRGVAHYQRALTPDEMVRTFCSGAPVREPGVAFDYNNADYLILGRIVERAVGKPFGQVLQERLLTPLGMRDSGLLTGRAIVPRLAPTYFRRAPGAPLELEMPLYPENWEAAGGMYATVDDLMRFADALFSSKLLKPSTLAQMLTPGLDKYGFGVWVSEWEMDGGRKTPVVFRPGGIMGATGVLFHPLEGDVTVAILSNTNRTDLDDFAYRIARAALG